MNQYKHLPSPVKFREDINGLRAWAVIAVLLFHFSLIGLPGGFVGVDVFFVISGYLMTAIIVGGYEKGNFSIWKFYMARARRILPALLLLIAVLLVLGWFWLPTPDYQALGAQSAYGMTFLSNIYYWLIAGYFDSAAEEKWLLHTWSLSVEAQFYVLYPIFIALIWRFWKSLKAITIAIFVMFISSLALNLVVTGREPSAAFYLLPTRGWELAAGGLVFLIAKQGFVSSVLKNEGYWLGWVLIITSFFFITEHHFWPGYWALLPVLGTSLIIIGQCESCKLTDNVVSQWLGDRSYSLYLWHWPLVVALSFSNMQSEWNWVIGAFALSIFLAHLSYKFVETPTRKYLSNKDLIKELMLIGFFVIALVSSAVFIKLNVFESRFSPEVEIAANGELDRFPGINKCKANHITGFPNVDINHRSLCRFNNDNPEYYLLGDSHTQSIISALIESDKDSLGVMFLGVNGCPFITNLALKDKACVEYAAYILEQLRISAPKKLIILNRLNMHVMGANDWDMEHIEPSDARKNEVLNAFQKTIKKLTAYGHQVYILTPVPEMGVNVPKTLSRNFLFKYGSDDIKISREEYDQRSSKVLMVYKELALDKNIHLIKIHDALCDDKYCYGSKNGRPLYYDDDHLSEYGSKFLVPIFEKEFKNN